ncbi:MAG: UGMP family protein [Candidatus Accumulibacter sp. SK-11]|nr:MAG: UGMP family protein [Candidatus Accumulibacter sp. SK-11]
MYRERPSAARIGRILLRCSSRRGASAGGTRICRRALQQATSALSAGRIRAMNLLAIDTSTESGSIALWCDGELLQRRCPAGLAHSQTLLPLLGSTLKAAGLGYRDLHGIAFAAGPGSFTGLRVACGVAQGLAVAHALPVIAVGTLEAMALASGGERVIVLLDARMGEVYHGRFVAGGPALAAAVCHPGELPLPDTAGWLACGNGLAAHPLLRQRLSERVCDWLPDLLPDAGSVARLAAPRLARGEGMDPAAVAPVYVRNKVALTIAERLASGGRA